MANYQTVYGVKHKDEFIRAASRSGGVFTALSDIVLEEGGIVYGCGLDERFLARHMRASTKQERDSFRGSKYVQSDVGDVMRQAEADLKAGYNVLFSGVPCQIHGLYNYLKLKKISTDKLLTVEILCHGAPSPRVWEDFLAAKYHLEDIEKVDFRDKKNFGWRDHVETVTVNGNEVSSKDYTGLFYAHVMLRESCFHCYYKKRDRVADITIGDFWRIENNDKDFDDDKGVSLVKLNTEKGRQYFKRCADALEIREYPLATCIQPALDHNYEAPPERDAFWNEYESKKILELANKYTVYKSSGDNAGIMLKIKRKAVRIIKNAVRRFR